MKELEYPFDSAWIRRHTKKIRKQLLGQEDLFPRRIAVLCGSTVGQMKDMLEVFLLNHGIIPDFFIGQYNNYYEEALFEYKELVDFKPDIIYIHTSTRNILEWPSAEDTAARAEEKLTGQVSRFTQMWDSLQQKTGCLIIQNNFEMLPYRIMGNMDAVHFTGRQNFLEALNRQFVLEVRKRNGIFINDIHYLSAYYGLERWFDDGAWYAFKYSFSPDAIPLAAFNIANIIKSYYGKNKKAVAVDLDNTLWKGVIGDDGPEGIEIGVETPEGMLHSDFQEYLKNIGNRGILLNICSKNAADAAGLGLSHPSSVLKTDDIAITKCNWERKSKNIYDISRELNLNTDSFVFIDDNPAEQEEVKSNIPDIAILPVQQPSDMRKFLDWSGYFEVTNYSKEDLQRVNLYKVNLGGNLSMNETDYQNYLLGLEMHADFAEVSPANIDRVTQLVNKTNQFNLTGLRLNRAEIEIFSKINATICGTLYDKYGNNGLVSVILGEIQKNNTLVISLWVMSCRVFKRQMEYAMFDHLVELCRHRNIDKILGKYIPTTKNMPVADLYKDLGFILREEKNGYQIWEYHIPDNYENRNRVIRTGKEEP